MTWYMRINFYLLQTFCPYLGSFFFVCVVFLSLRFGQNFSSRLLQVILPWPRIGMITLVTVFPVITTFHTEKDIETRLTKAWTAINRLSIIWKSDLTDKMKRSFFQAAVTSILLYGCTTWTLTKRLEKKLDGNYTRMLRAILNKSWQQHPTRHQL